MVRECGRQRSTALRRTLPGPKKVSTLTASIGSEIILICASIGYKKAEDLDGELQQLMKRALIAKLRGDEKLAEEWAQNHNSVYDQAMERIETR